MYIDAHILKDIELYRDQDSLGIEITTSYNKKDHKILVFDSIYEEYLILEIFEKEKRNILCSMLTKPLCKEYVKYDHDFLQQTKDTIDSMIGQQISSSKFKTENNINYDIIYFETEMYNISITSKHKWFEPFFRYPNHNYYIRYDGTLL